jgi:DNA-binding protein HU-beta
MLLNLQKGDIMTKSEFVAKLAESAKISRKQAGQVFATFVDTITGSLKGGERIALPGLGSFSAVKREARKGRNPQTGAEIKIPARKAVKFSASGALSRDLNGAKKAGAKAAAKKAPTKTAAKKKK